MKIIVASILVCIWSYSLKAQNIFPYKLPNCPTVEFCLDCGDVKASVDQKQFDKLIDDFNKSNDYGKISGRILLQVLVDSTGGGCVLSHTDNSNNLITQNIVAHLNNFKGWIPAKSSGKIEGRVSINMSVEIRKGIMTAKIERVDQKAFTRSFDHAVDPEIYNKNYVYKNDNLEKYSIKVWNSVNSDLPNNFDNNITIDNNNLIWLTIESGLVKFDGKKFSDAEPDVVDKSTHIDYYTIATDNRDVKWVFGGNGIYSFDNSKWTAYDQKIIGIKGAYKIVNNEKTGEVFFCSDNGLIILKDGKWTTLNQDKIKELPSNRIAFAKRDSKNRIWIGTFHGSVLIDENGTATSMNGTSGVFKGKCITSMSENEKGDVFLGLFEYDRKDKQAVNNDEGIAIVYSGGEVKQFTTSNSGMPFNHVTQLAYDKKEKVLWIATDRAGLVRYDLKNGWENYNNKNSGIPTSYIADMAFDKDGILYLATRQGLVKLELK